jgi:hypothetical protein
MISKLLATVALIGMLVATLTITPIHASEYTQPFKVLACKEIWSLDNGISLCHGCHKDIERIRTELKNMFVI